VAVWAEQPQVLDTVISVDPIDVIQVQCDRPPPPVGQPAFSTDRIDHRGSEQAQAKRMVVRVGAILYKDLA
jgi:hypothetical protein